MEAQLVGKMRSHVTLMTEGRPVRLIVMFALPLMLGNMFQELYSVVDSMIVGRNLGVSALAALGVTSWPIWIMVGMLMGLAQGISILLARLFGQGNECELTRGFGNAIILSAVFAAVLLLVGQLYARAILDLLDTPDELIPYSITYLRISISGIPVIMAYNLLSSALRALGDSRTPLYAMIGASVVNIVLDLLFVYVLKWGIGGAAWATVIAQAFSAAVCLKVVLRTSQLHISRSDLTPELSLSRKMLLLSMPMILQNFLIAGG